jgi:hypothetical protein
VNQVTSEQQGLTVGVATRKKPTFRFADAFSRMGY